MAPEIPEPVNSATIAGANPQAISVVISFCDLNLKLTTALL